MSKINNGGPAFPRTGYYPDTSECRGDALRERMPSITEPADGMTLRDYFAAASVVAAHKILLSLSTEQLIKHAETDDKKVLSFPRAVTKMAYELADGLIAERSK